MFDRLKKYLRGAKSHTVQPNLWQTLPPIFVYQMGKVGSTAIYDTLISLGLPNPVYHVHFLAKENLQEVRDYYRLKGTITMPKHLRLSEELSRAINCVDKSVSIKIVTLVRDPINRDISDLFQNIKTHHKELVKRDDALHTEKIMAHLDEHFMNYDEKTDYACTWMDKELKRSFGIDVYQYDFNREKGFSYIEKDNIGILILTVEGLPSNFEKTISHIVDVQIDSPLIKSSNVGESKWYKEEYKYIKDNYRLELEYLKKIYSTKYVRHFYDEKLLSKFYKKWAV